jgi:hypothetical protein
VVSFLYWLKLKAHNSSGGYFYIMPKSEWNEEKINFLKENYKKYSISELTKLLGYKSRTSVKLKKNQLGLDKLTNRIGDLSPLLSETYQAYYWIGFIFADGHLSKEGRLSVTSSHDKEHLQEFANFIGCKVDKTKKSKSKKNFKGSSPYFYRVALQHCDIGEKIIKKFNMSNTKTYNPPKLKWINEDWKFFCFLIGFIDGDGNIGKRGYVRIENHINWNNVHLFIKNKLKSFGIESSVSTVYKDNSSIICVSSKSYHFLHEKIVSYNLIVLKRKWNKKFVLGNLNFFTLKNNIENIKKWLIEGLNYEEISCKLNCSYQGVVKFCKRNKINHLNINGSFGYKRKNK